MLESKYSPVWIFYIYFSQKYFVSHNVLYYTEATRKCVHCGNISILPEGKSVLNCAWFNDIFIFLCLKYVFKSYTTICWLKLLTFQLNFGEKMQHARKQIFVLEKLLYNKKCSDKMCPRCCAETSSQRQL